MTSTDVNQCCIPIPAPRRVYCFDKKGSCNVSCAGASLIVIQFKCIADFRSADVNCVSEIFRCCDVNISPMLYQLSYPPLYFSIQIKNKLQYRNTRTAINPLFGLLPLSNSDGGTGFEPATFGFNST